MCEGASSQIQVQIARIRAERHLDLRSNVFYPHHGERTASHDKHHLPAHQVDQGKRQDEEEECDALFEVDTEDHRKGSLSEYVRYSVIMGT